MKHHPYAVIDLGTNTFHLLIAQQDDDPYTIKEITRLRRFIKLAEEGIETIGDAPYQRGLKTLKDFREILKQYNIPLEKVLAFGTAALRTASNGQKFIEEVAEETGIQIELIPGSREALLIHKGVSLLVPPQSERHLIMDIGGGSVEFILANEQGVEWCQSFPIGVAVLHNRFYHPDPISEKYLELLKQFLKDSLQPLQASLSKFPVKRLIGASGTFDVLETFLSKATEEYKFSTVASNDFFNFHQQLLPTSIAERRAIKGMPESRADMILVAVVLVEVVLRLSGIEEIIVSPYAMKEGMLAELLFEEV